MTVVLIGPPAAGKSRVGRRLAARLGRPFIDTDKVIVAAHGPIAEIFSAHGEPHFRALEREAVHEALCRNAVVSLGGGAVLDAATRRELAAASVVLITITAEAAAKRIDNGKRPLIRGIESWQALVDGRRELYASLAHYTVDSSTRPVDDIVEEIARWAEKRVEQRVEHDRTEAPGTTTAGMDA